MKNSAKRIEKWKSHNCHVLENVYFVVMDFLKASTFEKKFLHFQ